MIRAVVIDESLFDQALIENYQAYRAWLQYFLIHVIYSRVILVPSGRKECWIQTVKEIAPCCLSYPFQIQLDHFLPNRVREIPVTAEWRGCIRDCCQVEDAILDTLALAACEHVDVVITRSRHAGQCKQLPKRIFNKIAAWNQYPDKKRLGWESEGMGGRSINDSSTSDQLVKNMLRLTPSVTVCDSYIASSLLENVMCNGRGNWPTFQATLQRIWQNWCSVSGSNTQRLTVKSVTLRKKDIDKIEGHLDPHMNREWLRAKESMQTQAEILHKHLQNLIPRADLVVELLDTTDQETRNKTHDRFLLTGNWALQLSRGFDFEASPYREWFASLMPLDINPKAMLWTTAARARWPQ